MACYNNLMLSEDIKKITGSYLICINIPAYCDQDGRWYLPALWYKDLKEHLMYIEDLSIICPCTHVKPIDEVTPLGNENIFSRLRIVPLPAINRYIDPIKMFPVIVFRLWRAVKRADIVHVGIADWPIPFGWLAAPIAKLYRKKIVVIVESAPWRLKPGMKHTIKARLKAFIFETLGAWCVNQADLAIFTHEEYKASLMKNRTERGHVIHASWVDEDNMISDDYAKVIWREKRTYPAKELKLSYVGRLDVDKGVPVLLDAMKILSADNISINLDIVGEGEMLGECKKVSQDMNGAVKMRFLGIVPYGPELFEILRRYHAVVVPSISDEQPRILYDAFSQAVPVIASDTPGIVSCIKDTNTGVVVKRGDPAALADMIKWASQNIDILADMGLEALHVARELSHQKMHQKRSELLRNLLR